jgi:ubiquinone/menaquinone biosynthesis C-methylase UbiE
MMNTASTNDPIVMDARKQEEADFHNQREVDRQILDARAFDKKYSNKKWYSVERKSNQYSVEWLQKHCPGRVALDYCCGLGGMSLTMAKAGAFVHGIDIASESVETATTLLRNEGYAARSHMQVMDAEQLTFDDQMFDVIVCTGVLHHLDLNRAYPELSRVLKPGGKILCVEAVGHNPIIRWYRKLTPHLRTSWEVDHILKRKDLQNAKKYFDHIDVRFFHLCSILATPFRRTPFFETALSLGEAADSLLLRVPGLKWMAWQMVFELGQPKHANGHWRQAA